MQNQLGGTEPTIPTEWAQAPVLTPDQAARMLNRLPRHELYDAEAEQILLGACPVAVAAAYERWLDRV